MEDTAMGAVDAFGDGCDWYGFSEVRAENCGQFDDDDFTASEMCVACGGGRFAATDRAGDSCSWYAGRHDECGMWDDEDFMAFRDCYECASAPCTEQQAASQATTFTATDSAGDGCAWYIENPSSCGAWDDEDFSANDVCCACVGRPDQPTLNLSDFPGLSKAKVAMLLATKGPAGISSAGASPLNLAQQAKAALLTEAGCVSSNGTDSAGDGCSWYAGADRQGYCGNYDTATFSANVDCCECGGGAAPACVDSDRVDSYGDGCAWYEEHPDSCGSHDHAGFSAHLDCCICERDPLQPYTISDDMTVTDAGNDDCSWYVFNSDRCGDYDTDTFTAATACTACGGGVCVDGSSATGDRTGDTCEWYDANPHACGDYDDPDFSANVMCCACRGQTTSALNLASVHAKKPAMNLQGAATGACSNSATGFDTAGDSCDWYDLWPESCGRYNDDDFTAGSDCCACGGGTQHYDSYGDGCDWYTESPEYCGDYDDDDFTANTMCAACVNRAAVLQGSKGRVAMLNLMTAKSHAFPVNLAGVKKIPLSLVADMSTCSDDLSTSDSGGDDCSWYYAHWS